MAVLCVIPARGGSKRIKNKNILPINGKPLIAYTIEAALDAELVDKAVVSTEDENIAKVARGLGVDVVMRPDNLASDDAAIDDALRHALIHYEDAAEIYEIAVLLQANVPVRKADEIDLAIRKLKDDSSLSAAATAYAISQRPEWMKLIDPQTGLLKPFMPPTNSFRMQDLPELYLLDGAIIVIRKQNLMQTEGVKRIHAYMGEEVLPIIHDFKYAVEIDEEEDFALAEFYLGRNNLTKE